MPKFVNSVPVSVERLASLVDGHPDSSVELGDDFLGAASEVRLRLCEPHEDVPRVFVDRDARVLSPLMELTNGPRKSRWSLTGVTGTSPSCPE